MYVQLSTVLQRLLKTLFQETTCVGCKSFDNLIDETYFCHILNIQVMYTNR